MAFVCEIGGVDYGPEGENALRALHLTPAAHGQIGTATITIGGAGALFALAAKQEVFVYETNDGGDIVQRLFAGFVARFKTTIVKGTQERVWLIQCQDWNVLLDGIVGLAAAANAITVAADSFGPQVQSLVSQAQSGALVEIDAASGVVDLVGGLPQQVFRGMSLRAMIEALCAAAQRVDGALRPRFYLGYDTAVIAAFGAPVLQVYDYAVAVANWQFSASPGVGQFPILGTFNRERDASRLVNYAQTYLANNGLVSTAQDAASQADYPNRYSAQNAWAGEPLADRASRDSAEAQDFADSRIAESAFPQETISFSTDQRVQPGQFVDVTMVGEGLTAARYGVLATDWDFTVPGQLLATLTLGDRQQFVGADGDDAKADLRAAPSFNIRQYGAFADGVSDDSAAINAAIADAAWAGGGVVELGSGLIKVAAPIVLADGVHLRGAGYGATALDFSGMSGGAAGDPCISAAGTLGATIGTLALAVDQYANSLAFSADVGLAAGDILLIYDPTDYSFSGARANYHAGEYVRVLAYDAGTFTATLATRTHAAYGTAVEVYKPALVRTSVTRASLRYKYGYRGIKVALGQGCSFRELAMRGSEYSLLEINRSFECDVVSCVGIDDTALTVSLRYGLAITNSQRVSVSNSVFETTRHGLVTGGDAAAGSIPVRELMVTGCTISGTQSTSAGNGINGFDLHGNSEHVVVSDCNLPNGITLAGDHVLISGCNIRNGAGGAVYLTETLGFDFSFVGNQITITHAHPDNFAFLYCQFKSDYTARTGGTFRFSDNRVNMGAFTNEDTTQSTIGLYVFNVSGPADNAVVVEGNTFHSELMAAGGGVFGAYVRAFTGAGLREVIVRNNSCRGVGLRVEDTGSQYVLFEGNYVYGALDRGLMLQKPGGTIAYGQQVVVCRNNTVVKAKYNGIQLEGSDQSDTLLFVHHNLSINNNQSGNSGTIALETSIYGQGAERLIFQHNVCGDNQGTPTQYAVWCADHITNLYELSTHNVGSALTTVGLTNITNNRSGLGAITGVIDDTQHGSRAGGTLHADAVAGGAAGFLSGSDKTKLGQFSPTAGKTLAVAKSLTLDAAADGFTLTVPATGTAALLGTAQTFTAQQTFNVAGGPLKIDGAASTTRDIGYYSSNSLRWIVRANNTTESGNAGSNFQLIARSGSTVIGTALTVARDTLAATFGGEIAASNLAISSGKILSVANTLTLAAAADGFTLTVAATGTAALLGTAQTFTATQTFNALIQGNNNLRLTGTGANYVMGNWGVGTSTLDPWDSSYRLMNFNGNNAVAGTNGAFFMYQNAYFDGTTNKYGHSGSASRFIHLDAGGDPLVVFDGAAAGAANAAITWSRWVEMALVGGALKIGFLGAAAAAQQTGGAATAAGSYGATEQTMLNKVYSAMRTFGFLS